jgi:hypothetical protein
MRKFVLLFNHKNGIYIMCRLYFIILFLIISSSLLGFDGYWKERHPERNGDVPAARYWHCMCPIGERKALLLNGHGMGSIHFYLDTWLYDYDTDTWTKIECDIQPDTYTAGQMAQISKNRAFVANWKYIPGLGVGESYWIFDLDSMKWFILNLSTHQETYMLARQYCNMVSFGENVVMLYGQTKKKPTGYLELKYYETWLATMDTSKSYNDTNFIVWEKVNDEWAGDMGPSRNLYDKYVSLDFPILSNVGEKQVLYRPLRIDWKEFFIFDRSYKWTKLKSDSNFYFNSENIYMNLINHIVLDGGSNYINTNISHYLENENFVRNYHLLLDGVPNNRYRTGAAKLEDGKVMIFSGSGNGVSNDTWVFYLTDTTNIIEDITDTNYIFFEHNLLLLKNIERVEIYDIMGQLIKEYNNKDDGIIDLNQYLMGMYFLRYYDGKNYITKKIIKY